MHKSVNNIKIIKALHNSLDAGMVFGSYLHYNVECKIHEKIEDDDCQKIRCKVARHRHDAVSGTENRNVAKKDGF